MDRRGRLRKHYFRVPPIFLPCLTQCGKGHCSLTVENDRGLFGLRAVQKLRKIQERTEQLEGELLALVAGTGSVRWLRL